MGALRQVAWGASRLLSQNGGPVSHALYQAATLYRKTYKNLNYDMATNGEHTVLDRLASTGVRVVLDVGANQGDYTNACLERFPDAEVHAFEIAPPTYRRLVANVSSARARCNGVGLSDANGTMTLRYNPGNDALSSLVAGGGAGDGWQAIEVEVVTGDAYCDRNGVPAIDLLKVDVEGAEHLVLAGFAERLGRGLVSAVQFEFGMANIYSRFLMRDFHELFDRHGFVVGPIMPRGVAFKAYDPRDEDFQGPPNYLAVHRSKPHVIEAVRR